MTKRTKSFRAVEALEAVKERIDIELKELEAGEVNQSGKEVREKVLEIIEEQLDKEAK